jgi:predicted MFS family arabinose efflux permease
VPPRDAWLICAAAFLRSTAVGAAGVFLAIFLAEAGLSISETGVLIGIGLAGAAAMTAIVAITADRFGRRRTLILVTLMTVAGYAALVFSTRRIVLFPLAFVGMVNGMGRDRGPAGTLEQAILPETVDAARRTWTLAWYNVVLDAAHALGALAGGTPALLVSTFAMTASAAHRFSLLVCGALAGLGIIAYSLLSSRVEIAASPAAVATSDVDRRTRNSIVKLAALFGIDSLGGGFLSSALIAYWFFRRYGLSEGQLAVLFFSARVLNAVSHVGAAWLAKRFGLLNTMVFTHLPSSLLLMAAPTTPSPVLASALFLGREALVEMDVPTRQSYVMAIVPPHQRTFASGVTNLTRTAGWAIGSATAGSVMQHLVMSGPLFIGGALKILYDIVLYASFRKVKPPEELNH